MMMMGRRGQAKASEWAGRSKERKAGARWTGQRCSASGYIGGGTLCLLARVRDRERARFRQQVTRRGDDAWTVVVREREPVPVRERASGWWWHCMHVRRYCSHGKQKIITTIAMALALGPAPAGGAPARRNMHTHTCARTAGARVVITRPGLIGPPAPAAVVAHRWRRSERHRTCAKHMRSPTQPGTWHKRRWMHLDVVSGKGLISAQDASSSTSSSSGCATMEWQWGNGGMGGGGGGPTRRRGLPVPYLSLTSRASASSASHASPSPPLRIIIPIPIPPCCIIASLASSAPNRPSCRRPSLLLWPRSGPDMHASPCHGHRGPCLPPSLVCKVYTTRLSRRGPYS